MRKLYPKFWDNLRRYLTGRGQYPYKIDINTPIGIISPTLYSSHDLLTVNEIFCRKDYIADEKIAIILDLGSNIGISALYFLTRNRDSKCYLYEPDRRNVEKLKENMIGFESRYTIIEKAVSYESGKVEFGIESTGRYGGIGVKTGHMITVECLNVNDVISEILDKEGVIDVLKIDTEGVEIETVEAIDSKYANKIRKIYLEAHPDHALQSDLFLQEQYGSVCRLTNRNMHVASRCA